MITVRTFLSPAQAALAKSVLDNYEIPSALLDENAGLYNGGTQFAVPIRLIVDEAEAARADLILSGDFEKADNLELAGDPTGAESNEPPSSPAADRNPWELLVIAFYFLVPAICLVITKFPQDVSGRWARYLVARATIAQFLAWIGVIFAACLVGFYFWLRGSAHPVDGKNAL